MADDAETAARSKEISVIARWVLSISAVGVLLISLVALSGGNAGGKGYEASQQVFNSLLPLFGTWVGTILAYYFTSKNFESANSSVRQMVQTLDQRLRETPVEREMLRAGQITAVTMAAGQKDADIKLKDLIAKLTPPVTRIPILDSTGAVKYIVHQSGLYKFIAEQATSGKAVNIADLTLDDLVKDAELKSWVSNIVFIPASVSIADAKTRMEGQKGCQDLIVTKTGDKTEPMIGWMTNVDIGRLSKA